MRGRDSAYKCIYCGKYIAYRDIGTSKIGRESIPDAESTVEEYMFWHNDCKNNLTKQEG